MENSGKSSFWNSTDASKSFTARGIYFYLWSSGFSTHIFVFDGQVDNIIFVFLHRRATRFRPELHVFVFFHKLIRVRVTSNEVLWGAFLFIYGVSSSSERGFLLQFCQGFPPNNRSCYCCFFFLLLLLFLDFFLVPLTHWHRIILIEDWLPGFQWSLYVAFNRRYTVTVFLSNSFYVTDRSACYFIIC